MSKTYKHQLLYKAKSSEKLTTTEHRIMPETGGKRRGFFNRWSNKRCRSKIKRLIKIQEYTEARYLKTHNIDWLVW